MLVVIRIARNGVFIWGEVDPIGSYDVLIGKLQTWPVLYRGVAYKAKSGRLEVMQMTEDALEQVVFVIEMEEKR